MQSVTRPIRNFIHRQLNQRGWHRLQGTGLEMSTIEDFQRRAYEIADRRQYQTRESVAALKKKYEKPIIGEISVYRLLELSAQVLDPSNCYLYCASQLTHTLQVLESMEQVGVTEPDLIVAALIHDLGKLSLLAGELPENVDAGGKIPIGENEPGSGLENCSLTWDHSDIAYARFKPYVSDRMAWLLRWHSVKPECLPLMDERDRTLFETYYKNFAAHDLSVSFFHIPNNYLEKYREILTKAFPEPILF